MPNYAQRDETIEAAAAVVDGVIEAAADILRKRFGQAIPHDVLQISWMILHELDHHGEEGEDESGGEDEEDAP